MEFSDGSEFEHLVGDVDKGWLFGLLPFVADFNQVLRAGKALVFVGSSCLWVDNVQPDPMPGDIYLCFCSHMQYRFDGN